MLQKRMADGICYGTHSFPQFEFLATKQEHNCFRELLSPTENKKDCSFETQETLRLPLASGKLQNPAFSGVINLGFIVPVVIFLRYCESRVHFPNGFFTFDGICPG